MKFLWKHTQQTLISKEGDGFSTDLDIGLLHKRLIRNISRRSAYRPNDDFSKDLFIGIIV
jgi:hypothetical protein